MSNAATLMTVLLGYFNFGAASVNIPRNPKETWGSVCSDPLHAASRAAEQETTDQLFHSVLDGYSSVTSACRSLLGTGGRGLLSWHPAVTMTGPSSTAILLVFHTSFAVFRMVIVWLLISVLLRNYRRARAELYRPAVDLQDYEMVELFVRRLKMWMGLSRTKEFRHKVRFEGMELPPSRSSSTSDCRSLCLPPLDGADSPPTPDSVDGNSEVSWRPASSSPCSLTEAPGISVGLGLGMGLGAVVVGGTGWRESAETEASVRRLLPTLDALLQQLDCVTMATEDVYHFESKLERVQRKRRHKGREKVDVGHEGRNEARLKGMEEDKDLKEQTIVKEKQSGSRKGRKLDKNILLKECGSTPANLKKTPVATPVPFLKSKLAPDTSPFPQSSPKPSVSAPLPVPSANGPTLPKTPAAPPIITRGWDRETLPSTSLFNHPAHTTTIPTRKRKRKPPPLKNKVHPT